MIRIIAACSSNGIIGVANSLPFNYSADLKHFKEKTTGHTIVMGMNTFKSIGKILPNRQNIVLSRHTVPELNYPQRGLIILNHLDQALLLTPPSIVESKDLWIIGGGEIYSQAMKYAEEIHLTITPDEIKDKNSVKFPWIDPTIFKLDSWEYMAADPRLKYCIYKRQ